MPQRWSGVHSGRGPRDVNGSTVAARMVKWSWFWQHHRIKTAADSTVRGNLRTRRAIAVLPAAAAVESTEASNIARNVPRVEALTLRTIDDGGPSRGDRGAQVAAIGGETAADGAEVSIGSADRTG